MIIDAFCPGAKMTAGLYDVKVCPKTPKGAPPIVATGAFALRPPKITSVNPPNGTAGDTITGNGSSFGAKGTIGLRSGTTTYKTKASSWWDTGVTFVVSSKLPAGTYDVIVTTTVGTDASTGGFTKP
jgi:hypothetical protein